MVFLIVGILGNLSAQMTLFKGTFDEAIKKAREEKKDLFVDFCAEWCGPCKAMANEVFTQPEIGEYFNSRFVCVQVDVDAKEELKRALLAYKGSILMVCHEPEFYEDLVTDVW